VLLVVDIARRMTPAMVVAMEDMVGQCGSSGVPVVVAANKSDLIRGIPLSEEQWDIWRGREEHAQGQRKIQAKLSAHTPPHHDKRPNNPNPPDLLALKTLLLREWLEGACTRSGMLGEGGFNGPHIWIPSTARNGFLGLKDEKGVDEREVVGQKNSRVYLSSPYSLLKL